MDNSRIKSIRNNVKLFHIAIERLRDEYIIPLPVSDYLLIQPNYKKEHDTVTLCFKGEPKIDEILKQSCIEIFNRLFPELDRAPVLEGISCEAQSRK